MSPLGRIVFPRAPPSGKPSSLGETFHHVTPTGMAYLYNMYYANMTSLRGCQRDCLPRVSIVSRGADYHVGNPTGMSYLFYCTEHHPRATKIHDKLKITKLTWAETQLYRADHVGMFYLFYHTEQPNISR